MLVLGRKHNPLRVSGKKKKKKTNNKRSSWTRKTTFFFVYDLHVDGTSRAAVIGQRWRRNGHPLLLIECSHFFVRAASFLLLLLFVSVARGCVLITALPSVHTWVAPLSKGSAYLGSRRKYNARNERNQKKENIRG